MASSQDRPTIAVMVPSRRPSPSQNSGPSSPAKFSARKKGRAQQTNTENIKPHAKKTSISPKRLTDIEYGSQSPQKTPQITYPSIKARKTVNARIASAVAESIAYPALPVFHQTDDQSSDKPGLHTSLDAQLQPKTRNASPPTSFPPLAPPVRAQTQSTSASRSFLADSPAASTPFPVRNCSAPNTSRRRANAVSLVDSPARRSHAQQMATIFANAQKKLAFDTEAAKKRVPSDQRRPLSPGGSHTPSTSGSVGGGVLLRTPRRRPLPSVSAKRDLATLHTQAVQAAGIATAVKGDVPINNNVSAEQHDKTTTPDVDNENSVGDWTSDEAFYVRPPIPKSLTPSGLTPRPLRARGAEVAEGLSTVKKTHHGEGTIRLRSPTGMFARMQTQRSNLQASNLSPRPLRFPPRPLPIRPYPAPSRPPGLSLPPPSSNAQTSGAPGADMGGVRLPPNVYAVTPFSAAAANAATSRIEQWLDRVDDEESPVQEVLLSEAEAERSAFSDSDTSDSVSSADDEADIDHIHQTGYTKRPTRTGKEKDDGYASKSDETASRSSSEIELNVEEADIVRAGLATLPDMRRFKIPARREVKVGNLGEERGRSLCVKGAQVLEKVRERERAERVMTPREWREVRFGLRGVSGMQAGSEGGVGLPKEDGDGEVMQLSPDVKVGRGSGRGRGVRCASYFDEDILPGLSPRRGGGSGCESEGSGTLVEEDGSESDKERNRDEDEDEDEGMGEAY